MCARFLTPTQAAAERYCKAVKPLWEFAARWRVPPIPQIPIVLAIDGVTTGRTMRWGLVSPSGSSSYPLINATVEKVEVVLEERAAVPGEFR